MNKKRALKVLEMFLDKQCSIERTLSHMDTTDVEIWDAVYTATKALSAEPCEDAISRQAVMDFIRGLTRWCVRSEDGKFNNVGLLYDDVMFGLDRLPSVTPKQKMGRWEEHNDDHYDWVECSDCGYGAEGEITSEHGVRFNFCPNCGAKMEENPTGSNCTDCVLDGTDACTRGAGRAVDGRTCEDFVGGK